MGNSPGSCVKVGWRQMASMVIKGLKAWPRLCVGQGRLKVIKSHGLISEQLQSLNICKFFSCFDSSNSCYSISTRMDGNHLGIWPFCGHQGIFTNKYMYYINHLQTATVNFNLVHFISWVIHSVDQWLQNCCTSSWHRFQQRNNVIDW